MYKLLRDILKELKSINKKLPTIESSQERSDDFKIDSEKLSHSVVEAIRDTSLKNEEL